MKLASALLAVVGISITPLVLADIKMCKPAQIEKLVTKLVSKGKTGVHDCQAASGGFSIFPPSSQPPTNDQLRLMCTSDACLDLVTEFLHGDLIDCDIKWDGVSLNPHLLVSKFKESCEKLSAAHDEKKWLDWSSYRKTVPVEIVYESEMKSKTKTPAVDWVERNPYQPKEPKEPKSSPAPALAPPPSSKYEPYHPTPQPKEKYSTPTPSIDEGYDHDESKKEQYPTPAPGYPKCNNLYQPEGAPWTKDTYTAPSPSHHSYKEDTPSKPEEHQYVTPEPESSYSVEDTYSDVKVQEQPQHQPEQLPKSSSTPSVDKYDSSYPMKSSPVEVYATPAPVLAPAPVDKYPSTWSQETSASPHKGKYAEYLSDDDDDNDDDDDQKSKEEKHGGEKPSDM